MTAITNKYAAQAISGNFAIRTLRRFQSVLLRPRGLSRLGAGTYIGRPYRFTIPSRVEIGERCVIGSDCLFQPIVQYLSQSFDPHIKIGDDTYIGPKCQFNCANSITLGRGCVLSDEVYLSDVSHGFDPFAGLIMDQPISSKGPIQLGEGCFIGFGSTVLAGVQLGAHCVVGARSVVTRSYPEYTMLAGNPARPLARYDVEACLWVRLSTTTPDIYSEMGMQPLCR